MAFFFKPEWLLYPVVSLQFLLPLNIYAGIPEPPKYNEARNPDSVEAQLKREFQTAYAQSTPFSAAAIELGMSIPDSVVKERVDILRQVYPDAKISPSQAKEILLAEKYLEGKGIASGEMATSGTMKKKLESIRFSSPHQKAAAEKAAHFRELVNRQEVREEANNLMDLAQIRRYSGDDAPQRTLALAELQIRGKSDDCLAWAAADCFVTVKEYNAAAAAYSITDQTPLDSAKVLILRNYLADKRLADSARSLNLIGSPDSLIDMQIAKKEGIRWLRSAKKFGMPVREEPLLQAAYGRYYSQYFSRRKTFEISVIGSSDSAYIDSLHKAVVGWEMDRKSALERKKRPPEEPVLPWIYFKDKELPTEVLAGIESLEMGHCSSPFRVPFGYFIARATDVEIRREVSFPDAFPNLVYLATRDKYLDRDSVVESQAKRYYGSNPDRFSFPDTLGLKVWMVPRGVAGNGRGKGSKLNNGTLNDTINFKPMAMSSLALGEDWQIRLRRIIRQDTSRSFFGPLEDGFGCWYFKIQSKKMSRTIIPYRLVRPEILKRISAPLIENEWGLASPEAKENVMLNLGLAEAYRESRYQKEMGFQAKAMSQDTGKGEAAISAERREARGTVESQFESDLESKRRETASILKEARADLKRLLD